MVEINRMMMQKNLRSVITLSILLLGTGLLTAQSVVLRSTEIDRMLAVYAAKNKSQETIKAWRIQVVAVSDRREMENEKSRFESIYPSMRLEWVYDNPYYILKLRDAAFKEKLDALNLLHRIKHKYPAALLVIDDVKPEKVFSNPDL
ncbi:MAG: SPOR domain-containing protein [Saprospiraceae bacterium]|nr:SPOR domain-containing protein [Saprospiraceae bacterium]